MRSRQGKFLHWVEVLLWLVSAGTLGLSIFVFAQGKIYQFYLNWKFDDALDAQQLLADTREKAQSLISASASARTATWQYLGRLEIPRLDISIMLLDGIDNRTLRLGIGHIPGTALPGQPGNAGIAGHRDTFFRGLARIRKDDQIMVETLDGEYHYVVESIQVVDPDAIEVLNDMGHPVLTLVTCYPFHLVGPAPRRFVGHASLKER